MVTRRWYVRAWRWVTGLRVSTRHQRDHQALLLRVAQARAEKAQAKQREVERLLVLLSEPLKDWDLADYPDPGYLRMRADKPSSVVQPLGPDDFRHLANVLDAYRLTASAVAPLRANRVVDDQARGRGWDDQPLSLQALRGVTPRRLP